MEKVVVILSTLSILFCGITLSYGKQTVSAEAKRHFDRGLAALEMASPTDDYNPAIKEFEQAISLAPDWPDVYYKLGMVQEKAEKYSAAVTNLKQYLRLVPNASDAEAVKSLINKLEYKKEEGEGIKRVYAMMASGSYERKEVNQKKLSGKERIWGPLDTFRMVAGEMQVSNHWYVSAAEHGGYHPKQHPPIPREWEPVKVKGRFYEYTYLYYMDMLSNYGGYVAQVDNEVKGEIISIDPPRVKEIAKQSVSWGAPIEGNKNPWIINDNYNVVTEYIYELIAKGADINAKDCDGRTRLHLAVIGDTIENDILPVKEDAALLIAKGADVNARDKNQWTPLHLAVFFARNKDAALLIAKGADINAKDQFGEMPLHIAVRDTINNIRQNKVVEIVELLIAKGADINAKDELGNTPLQYAESNNLKDVAGLLKKHGAR
ncbi:MAG: ankyrin repeat domain-containing protein [Candidatus Omnitrophota bacterium]|jgi:hypothetical protein